MIRLDILVALLLTACVSPLVQQGNLFLGSRLAVERECADRGVVVPSDSRLYGCADFSRGEIVSVDNPKVIAHERCHLEHGPSHEACPTPVLP